MEQKKNSKGQFIKTTGSTNRKVVQYCGVRMGEHKRNICVAIGLTELPKEFVVHHINRDQSNNTVDNLAIMTITAHNRIHSHTAWNKGIKASENPKWKRAIEKAQKNRKLTFISGKFKDAYEMRLSGKTFIEIGKLMGTSRETASQRYKKYKKYLNNKS